MTNTFPTIIDVEDAARHLPRDIVYRTPLFRSERLSQRFQANIFIKNEGQQSVGSYKIRGAANAIRLRSFDRFVAASAGNHSQGVALGCQYFRRHATIFMPKTTPPQKIGATRNRGGEWIDIVLVGDDFDTAYHEAKAYAIKHQADFIHPFDDADVIAGQGTVALEIVEQMREHGIELDMLFAPIGGGGLIAGTLSCLQSHSPHAKVIGVEPTHADCMHASIRSGHIITLERMSTFIDGAAVRTPGGLAFDIVRHYQPLLMRVPEDRVCASLLRLLHFDKIVAEPAGALSIDALESCREEIRGKNVVCILSGSNMDASRYAEIIRRKERYKRRRRYLAIKIPNRPDGLMELLQCMKGQDINIRHFHFEEDAPGGVASVLIGIEAENQENLYGAIELLSLRYDLTEETHNPLLANIFER